jgi:fructosamine-3-kinase
MWKNLINDVVACGMYNNEEALSLISLLEAYEAYFQRQSKPALLHMGIRKENIMVDQKGTITGLLGFEAALWGDPEVEFAVLDCAGIWASAFWKGYGAPRPTDLGSRTRRKFYILYEVQKNIPLAAKRYYDPEEAEQYKQTAITIATNLASATP